MKVQTLRRFAFVVFLFQFVVALSACKQEIAAKPKLYDFAGQTLPLPAPELPPLDRLAAANELPPLQEQIVVLRRAFFMGNFEPLDAALLRLHEAYVARNNGGQVMGLFLASFGETKLAGVDACNRWTKSMPNSFIAHWVCGKMWSVAARQIRGGKYIKDTSPVHLILMHERYAVANSLLEKAIALHPQPVAALVQLADNHFTAGDRSKAESLLDRAERIRPDYLGVHTTRMMYRQPKWGGSDELVAQAYQTAKNSGMDQNAWRILNEHYYDNEPNSSSPGVAKRYWEEKVRQQATRERLIELLNQHYSVSDWNQALPVATRLVTDFPDVVLGHSRRGLIHEKLGMMVEARQDYWNAAAMGDDWSTQELIMANLRGGLGVSERSVDTILELCRYGAYLGSPSALNCVGSLYHEGPGAGHPFKTDHAQSLAWHLMAARAGHFNSQHDFGWFLFTGRGDGIETDLAKQHGVFWLRRAAEQDQAFAKRKLDEQKISLEEPTGAAALEWTDYLQMGISLVSRLILGVKL